jgi:protein-S-isoprenylcysteine O-methyltransferase Ste14
LRLASSKALASSTRLTNSGLLRHPSLMGFGYFRLGITIILGFNTFSLMALAFWATAEESKVFAEKGLKDALSFWM